MAFLSTHDNKVLELLKRLGLDTSKTQSVQIEINTDDLVRMNVTYFLTKDDIGEIDTFVKRYNLQAVEEK